MSIAYPCREHRTDAQIVKGLAPWLVMAFAVAVLVIAIVGPFPIFR